MLDNFAVVVFVVGILIAGVLGYIVASYKVRHDLRGEWEKETKKVTTDSIKRSRATLRGQFVEQLAPFFPEFKYDPTEARFLGSPIDIICFPGLSTGTPEEVVFIEVKSGDSDLTKVERKIRDLINSGSVRWELMRPL